MLLIGLIYQLLFSIITRVTDFIGDLAPKYIRQPNENEAEVTKEFFKEYGGLKDVIGIVDGSKIIIDRPSINKDSYYDRQDAIIFDHNHKIIDFFAGYPGSIHDARVFHNSPLR